MTLQTGAQFCFKHYKDETENKRNNITINDNLVVQQKCSTPKKEVFEPEEICISEEISDKAYNSGVSLTQTLDNSLPTYQIKRKRVSDLVNGTKQKLKKKLKELKCS